MGLIEFRHVTQMSAAFNKSLFDSEDNFIMRFLIEHRSVSARSFFLKRSRSFRAKHARPICPEFNLCQEPLPQAVCQPPGRGWSGGGGGEEGRFEKYLL